MPTRIAVILLAAGGSTRLGSAKQALVYEGKSLLRRAAETALAVAEGGPVAVVLGARVEVLRAEVDGLGIRTVENTAWERGIGGSVRRGMMAVDEWMKREQNATLDGVLLTLCDQPFVGAEALGKLAAAFAAAEREDAISAAAYLDTVGVPVLFGRAYFEALRTLPEDAGAKGLLRRYAEQVISVPTPEAAVDIDTLEQYERLKGVQEGSRSGEAAPSAR